MKIEEAIEINSSRQDQTPYYAFILSIVWNLCVLFLLFFVARQQHTLNFNASSEPLVVFQNPLEPAPLTQNNPAQQLPAQQLQALQQIAMQQPQDFTNPAQDELNYLVQQLISYGNSNWGAVVSAVDDLPGHSTMATAEPEPAPIEDQSEPSSEKGEDAGEESSQKEGQEAAASDQSPSRQDREIIQETAQAIAATMPAEKTTYGQSTAHGGHHAAHRTSGSIAHPNKQQLTMADLAHSFMRQVRDEKQIKYHYDPQQQRGGMPGVYSPAKNGCSGKELALQMYAGKVFMMMQQSAHALSSLIYANADFTEQSLLEITINYDGKLLRVALDPPIHEKDVELAVQKIVERVGLFPPIPKHFNTDSMTLTFPLNIQGTKGFGRYSLSYSASGRP